MAKVKIEIPSAGEEFQVSRFAEMYENFLSANPSARPRLRLFALLLVVVGVLAVINGLLAFAVGHSYLIVKLIDGSFVVQYI